MRAGFVLLLATASACAAGPPRAMLADTTVADAAVDAATEPLDEGPPEADAAADAADAAGETTPVLLAAEPPYAPGTRPRPKTAVAASSDDEMVARYNRGSGPPSPGKPPHPAPRIRVDVVKTSFRSRGAELLRVARAKGYWPIRLCYEEGLRGAQRMHAALRFSLRVGASGAVREVRTMHAGTAETDVAVCIAKAIRKLTLAGPPRGTGTAVLEVSLWPGDAPVFVPAAAEPLPWSAAELDAVLRTRLPDIERCYRAGLARDGGLWGRIAVETELLPDGSVAGARESESRFPDPEVTRCVADALRTLTLRPSDRSHHVVFAARLGAITEPPDAG